MVEEIRLLVIVLVNVNLDFKILLFMKDKMNKVFMFVFDMQIMYDDRFKFLELIFDVGDKFWMGLDEIKYIFKDVQDYQDFEELLVVELEVLEEQIYDYQVGIFYFLLF